MPQLETKVEGKGNGIKTVINNMSDIAKSLKRSPTYLMKYISYKLGTQTRFDTRNERYIVNGNHDPRKLQDLLDGFISSFVLCQECDNPETSLVVKAKRRIILQKCNACGYENNINMLHKLSSFILNNPPPSTFKAMECKSKNTDN
jgi:translation initiation factor 5